MTCKLAILIDNASESDLTTLTRRLSNELSPVEQKVSFEPSTLLTFSKSADIADAYSLLPHLDALIKLYKSQSSDLMLHLFASLEDRLLLISCDAVGAASIPVNHQAFATVVANFASITPVVKQSKLEIDYDKIGNAIRKTQLIEV